AAVPRPVHRWPQPGTVGAHHETRRRAQEEDCMSKDNPPKDNPFKDIDALRAAGEVEAAKEKALRAAEEAEAKFGATGKHHRRRKGGFVVMAPDGAAALSRIRPPPPWGVAIFLIRAFRRQASRQVVVANGALEAWGVGPEAKLHDLREIEAA